MGASNIQNQSSFSNKVSRGIVVFLFSLTLFACGDGGDKTPAEHVSKAKVHMENQELMEAVIELKNAIQKEANLPEARWLLGETYLKLGNGGLAYREFKSAQSLGYTHPELENNLLRALTKQGKYQDVLDRTAQAASDGSLDIGKMVIRGDALLSLGELDQAEELFNNIKQKDKNLIDAYIGLARVAFGRNKIEEAEVFLDDALQISKDSEEVWILKGLASLITQDLTAGEESFSKAVAIAPYNVNAYVGLVRSQLLLGKKEDAKKHLAIIEKYNKNIPIVRYFRAYLKYQEDDLDGAKLILNEILKNVPGHPEATLLLSNVLYRESKLEQVISHLSKFNAQFPLHVPAAKLLAISYVSQNQPDKAIEVLEKVSPTNQNDSQLLALLGSAYMRTGGLDKGTEYLKKASEISPDVAEIKTQLALSHLASGATGQAVNELETAMELDPNLYSADILLILTHIRESNFDKAISASQVLIDKDNKNPLSHNLKGTAYLAAKDFENATASFETALKLDPEFITAMFNLAVIDLEQGNKESGEKRYQEILKSNPGNEKALLSLARMESEKNNVEKMLEYLEESKELNPEALETRYYIARYYQSINDVKQMLNTTAEMVTIEPENPEVQFIHARANRLNGSFDLALDILDDLISKYGTSEELLKEKSLVFVSKREFSSAINALEGVLDKNPENKRVLIDLANLRINNKEFEKAEALISQFEETNPDSGELYVSKGYLAFTKEDYETAISFYKKALELLDNNAVFFRLYDTYRVAGKTDEAKESLEKWMEKHPDNNQALHLSASESYQIGENEKAILLYERILLGNDSDVIALNNLAWLYFQEGRPRALEYAEKSYKLAPESPEIMDTLGWILVQNGQVERGIGLLVKAADSMKSVPSVSYHLAYALEKSGDKDKAKSILTHIIQEHPEFDEREDAMKLLEKLQ